MNESIVISHKINEILSRFYKKEDTINILLHCVETLVILPRLELLSVISVLNDHISDKLPNETIQKKLNTIVRQARSWLFSPDNEKFYDTWRDDHKEIPSIIDELYQNSFGHDVSTLIEEYIEDTDEMANEVEKRQNVYLREWLEPIEKEIEIEEIDHERERMLNYEKHLHDEEVAKHNIFRHQKTFKQREADLREEAKAAREWAIFKARNPEAAHREEREFEKREKMRAFEDMKAMNPIQEVKKRDRERFGLIFYAFEKKFEAIPQRIQDEIVHLWYGDFYSDGGDNNSDNVLSVVKKYSLHFKISNDRINGDANRLILQTYIVGLRLGLNVYEIYTIITNVLKISPELSAHTITPAMIHDGSIPSIKIQEVLGPIFSNLPLHGDIAVIRKNWNKMRFPKIDISRLVEYLSDIINDSSLKYTVIAAIEDLTDVVVSKHLNIDKFAREVFRILQVQKSKVGITEKEIISLLDYE